MVDGPLENLASLDADESTKNQMAWLEQQLVASIKEHQLLNREIRSLGKDIDEFASEYHTHVGMLVEELDALDQQITGQATQKPTAQQNNGTDNGSVPMITNSGNILHNEEKEEALWEAELHRYEDEAVDGESKRLYRKLAKKIHPDTSKDEPEADEAFTILKEAHEKKDLSTMLLLERALDKEVSGPPATQLEVMQQQFEAIQRQNDELRRERHELMRSDTYTLRIRALNAHVEGKDLLGAIAASIQIQIDEKKKILQTARYQQS